MIIWSFVPLIPIIFMVFVIREQFSVWRFLVICNFKIYGVISCLIIYQSKGFVKLFAIPFTYGVSHTFCCFTTNFIPFQQLLMNSHLFHYNLRRFRKVPFYHLNCSCNLMLSKANRVYSISNLLLDLPLELHLVIVSDLDIFFQ